MRMMKLCPNAVGHQILIQHIMQKERTRIPLIMEQQPSIQMLESA